MIYLIGGVPRAGKSTLSHLLVERNKIPFVPLDSLVHMIKDVVPDLKMTEVYDQIPEKFYPFLERLTYYTTYTVPNYVIEGDCLLPRHVDELRKKYEVKSVFLGNSNTNMETIRKYVGHNDWMDELPPEQLADFPNWLIKQSLFFAEECKKYNITYIDMTDGLYSENLERAYASLIS